MRKCESIEAKVRSGKNLFGAGAWKTRAMTLSIDNDTSRMRGRLKDAGATPMWAISDSQLWVLILLKCCFGIDISFVPGRKARILYVY